MISGQFAPLKRGILDTLAQTGTRPPQKGHKKPGVIVTGKGSDLSKKGVILGRAKRKQVTQAMTLALIKIAEEENNKVLLKGFWNSYHCLNKVYEANGKVFGKYCKNRFCTVCLAIRKAEFINSYLPVLEKWEEPYFVTLTVKSVGRGKLRQVIESMNVGLRKILTKHKKRNQRGTGVKIMGIKSLECNFNPKAKTYNPHFHLIVNSKESAEIILNEWLTYSKKGWTNRYAQDIRKITDKEKCLIEVVKYGSKIFTEPDVNKKAMQETKRTIYAKALYTILQAMQGQRIFDRFGFNLPKMSREIDSSLTKLLTEYNEFTYDGNRIDWVDVDSDETLAGYFSTPQIRHLLQNCIDLDLN